MIFQYSKKNLLFSLLLFAHALVFSNQINAGDIRDVQRELNALSQAFIELEAYQLIVEVQLFNAKSANAPILKKTFDVRRLGKTFLTQQAGLILLAKPNYTIVVDEVRQIISCQPTQRSENQFASSFDTEALGVKLQELSQQGIQFSHLGSSSFGNHLSAIDLEGPIRQMDLFIDPDTHLMTRINYHYRVEKNEAQGRTEITYTWKDSSGLREEDFSENTYVRVENDVILPSEKYKSFEIIGPDCLH